MAATFFQVVIESKNLSLLFSRLNTPSSLGCSSSDSCSRPFPSFIPLLWKQPQPLTVVPEVRGPELNAEFKVQPHQRQAEEINIPVLLAIVLLIQAKMPSAFLATRTHPDSCCAADQGWAVVATPGQSAGRRAGSPHRGGGSGPAVHAEGHNCAKCCRNEPASPQSLGGCSKAIKSHK